jgi:PAS domain S-box-containing protein
MSFDSPLENVSNAGPVNPAGVALAAACSYLLEALPGPTWIVDCAQFLTMQCNSATKCFSDGSHFLACLPSLDDHLLERLRSPERQISFHAVPKGERNHWLFTATLLTGILPAQRLILAQPAALFGVPAELTFDEMLDSAFDGLLILDADRRIVQISARFREMFGYTIEELHGKSPEVLVPPCYARQFGASIEKLDRGGAHHIETSRLRRDGTLLEVQISSQPIASGRFRGGMVGIYRDLTEVNRNARYRDLQLEATRILSATATLKQAAHELLPAIAIALGWDAVRLWQPHESGLECVHSFFFTTGLESLGEVCTTHTARVARDGQSIWLGDIFPTGFCAEIDGDMPRDGVLAALPILEPQQQVLGVLELLTFRNVPPEPPQRELLEGICVHLGQFITRCRAEMALAENETRFRTLAETAPIAIFIHEDGLVRYLNAACEQVTGYSREELMNRSVWPLFHPEDQQELQERARRRLEGEDIKMRWEARMVRKNGEVRWAEYSAARITINNRPAVLCAATDVTERRALEVQLRQTQKMEAIGRLAGGIAHDFNNLLMVIGCCSEVISMAEGIPEEVLRSAAEITHAADRAAALTRQLLAFGRRQLVTPRVVDLNSVLKGTELILRRALGDDITLHVNLESAACPILADASQVEQVVMNLAVNARDAMPNGGELSISTLRLNEVSPQESVPASGPHIVLTVRDTGTGMSQETQQHIFEPFFTTKQAGKGTGLGLSTVYGIVKQCGGSVTVESCPQRGATFKVFFPVANELPAYSASTEPLNHAARKATILLVEDEEDVRAVLHNSLIRDGHIVLQASSGAMALELSSAHGGKIDLLLTDVVMPGMSGRDLADQLLQLRPGIKVLYVSGYNEDTVLQKGVIEGKMEFLQKPFSPSDLSRKVREILAH